MEGREIKREGSVCARKVKRGKKRKRGKRICNRKERKREREKIL